MVGMVAIDKRPAKIAAEPVMSSTYRERASLRIPFPMRELICPKIRNVKLCVNSFVFVIAYLQKYNLDAAYNLDAVML